MVADHLAEWAGKELPPSQPTLERFRETGVEGGTWWPCSVREPVWDDMFQFISRSGRGVAETRYWQTRQNKRGVAELRDQVGWDRRVQTGLGRKKRARGGVDLFRTKLWWDHLPSPEVLQRGKEATGDEACPYCAETGVVSTWHILAACPNEALQRTRTLATELIHRAVTEHARGDARALAEWRQGYATEADGRWREPEGWREEEDKKAGCHANPWYGCLPRQWLDLWGAQHRGRDKVTHWELGQVKLGKVSAAAVQGCQLVWGEATRLWREAKQQEEWGARAQSKRAAAGGGRTQGGGGGDAGAC